MKAISEELLGPLNDVELKYAPQYLYAEGRVELLKQCPRVAVVGSRDASADALEKTRRLVSALVKHQAIIVSGLARGIDTVAHRTAIENGGNTIAVLGTPLNKATPVANRGLQDFIKREHLAVSQFDPGATVQKHFFPARNRTMALICQASIIMEAGDGSGTLSQGWEALRLGRPLFITPEVVKREHLNWPVQMIEYGARVLEDIEDVLEVLPPPGNSLCFEYAF